MANFDEICSLRPQYTVVAHSKDVVELRAGVWNPISITLSDPKASGKLLRTVELLDGTRTLAQVAREAELSKPELEKIVSYLEHYNAISVGPNNIFDYQVSLLRGTLANGNPPRKGNSRIRILSDSHTLGRELASIVSDFVDNPDVIDPKDPLLTSLANDDLTLTEDPLRQLLEKQKVYDAWEQDLLVGIFETINPILLRNLNRVALRHRFSWLHSVLDGPFVFVGPTFIPRSSPCYECFEGRVALNIREVTSYTVYKRALAEGKTKAGMLTIPRSISGLLISLTGFEVLNFLSTGSTFTIGKTLAVYLPTFEFSFNTILRLPGCPGCGQVSEKTEQNLYFHLKGVVNELYDQKQT